MKDTKVQLLGKRVAFKPIGKWTNLDESGLITGELTTRDLEKGEVVAVGDEVLKVSVGDIIVTGQTAGNSFTFDNVTYKMLDETAVIGKLPNNPLIVQRWQNH